MTALKIILEKNVFQRNKRERTRTNKEQPRRYGYGNFKSPSKKKT